MAMPTRIFIDRERVAKVKEAYAAGRIVDIPLFKIRRASGLVRASTFVVRDADGRELVRGKTDPSGETCGATAWVEVADGVTVEFGEGGSNED